MSPTATAKRPPDTAKTCPIYSPTTLVPLSFVTHSDFVRTSFGAASENTRTRSERGPNERGLRVEREWNKSGTRLYKKLIENLEIAFQDIHFLHKTFIHQFIGKLIVITSNLN